MSDYYSVRWMDGCVSMLDQRLLPGEVVYLEFKQLGDIACAIQDMVVRGAPAIGIAAGFGLALTTYQSKSNEVEQLLKELENAAAILKKSRPTAVNLFWSVDRIIQIAESHKNADITHLKQFVISEAVKIADEDVQMNKRMGMFGQRFIPDRANVIHHCNTGALATGGYGTALGVIRTAHESGKKIHVYVDETRPRLQGARLTAWELKQLGIPHTIIVDGASGYIMTHKSIDACLVGCDRIAANGDVANKIGTYNLAIVAHAHQVPFYSIGPTSSIDHSIASGDDIPIEERSGREVTHIGDVAIAPAGVHTENPAFDITPAKFITAIITNIGVIFPPYGKNLKKVIEN